MVLGRLPRQWLLQPSDAPVPDDAIRIHEQHHWVLYANDQLVIRVASNNHRTVAIGGVASDATDPAATLEGIARRLAGLADRGALERALENIVGCYVVFVWSDASCSVYTDPASILGVYHDPDKKIVASTPSLLDPTQRDPRTSEWFGARPSNNWVPSPYTIFTGIEVVPANHVLDTSSWQVQRFWPTGIDETGRSNAIEWISTDLRMAMESVVHDGRSLHVSITGGYDSRANLAAARQVRDRMAYFTLRNPGVSRSDVELAMRVARMGDVELRVIDCPEPLSAQLEAYDRQCAYQAFGARREIVGGCALVADGPAIHINGGLGVLLKNFYGSRFGPRSQKVRLSELVTDFDHPPPLVVQGVQAWLDSVSEFPPELQRTLMYLEQRAPRWMGPAELASTLYYDPYSPFTSRRIAMAAAFAPNAILEGGRLHAAVIERLWPDLLQVPFTKARSPLRRALPRGLKERLRPLKKMLDDRRRVR